MGFYYKYFDANQTINVYCQHLSKTFPSNILLFISTRTRQTLPDCRTSDKGLINKLKPIKKV